MVWGKRKPASSGVVHWRVYWRRRLESSGVSTRARRPGRRRILPSRSPSLYAGFLGGRGPPGPRRAPFSGPPRRPRGSTAGWRRDPRRLRSAGPGCVVGGGAGGRLRTITRDLVRTLGGVGRGQADGSGTFPETGGVVGRGATGTPVLSRYSSS